MSDAKFLGLTANKLARVASDLDAENARLRETLQRRNRQFEGMTEMWVERGVENAKLLKFAITAWELLTCNEPVFVWSGLQEKARELGIEVCE